MKGNKETPAATVKKRVAPAKSVRSRTKQESLNGPTEDQIRLKAQELYNHRVINGLNGTPEDDWHNAERILRGY